MKDIFISYHREDNQNGLISGLVQLIGKSFTSMFPNKELDIHFDITSIRNHEDWEHKTYFFIRESKIFFAFITPGYMNSEWCEREWFRYLNVAHIVSRGNDGLYKIYLIKIPDLVKRTGDDTSDLNTNHEFYQVLKTEFEKKQFYIENDSTAQEGNSYFDFSNFDAMETETMVGELNKLHKQSYDQFSLNNHDGLKKKFLYNIQDITKEIALRLDRILLSEFNPGNIHQRNADKNFTGRYEWLNKIHRSLLDTKCGTISSIHSIGGMGKTALARQYAHSYSEYYVSGGTWILDAQVHESIFKVLKAAFENRAKFTLFDNSEFNLDIDWNDNSTDNDKLKSLLKGLKDYTNKNTEIINLTFNNNEEVYNKNHPFKIKPRILLIFDNITKVNLLSSDELSLLPEENWLTLLFTSRLGEEILPKHKRLVDFKLDYLNKDECKTIFKNYRVFKADGQKVFESEEYKKGIDLLINELGGYPLTMVLMAAYLGVYNYISPINCLEIMKTSGLLLIDDLEKDKKVVLNIQSPDVGEGDLEAMGKRLEAVIQFPYSRLREDPENKYALRILQYAVFLDNEYIDKELIEQLILHDYPELTRIELHKPNKLVEAWKVLHGLMLLENSTLDTSMLDASNEYKFKKIHLLVAQYIKQDIEKNELHIPILKNYYEFFEYGYKLFDERNTISKIMSVDTLIKYFMDYDILNPDHLMAMLHYFHIIKNIGKEKLYFNYYNNLLKFKSYTEIKIQLNKTKKDSIGDIIKYHRIERAKLRTEYLIVEYEDLNTSELFKNYGLLLNETIKSIRTLDELIINVQNINYEVVSEHEKIDLDDINTAFHEDYMDIRRMVASLPARNKDYKKSLELYEELLKVVNKNYLNQNIKFKVNFFRLKNLIIEQLIGINKVLGNYANAQKWIYELIQAQTDFNNEMEKNQIKPGSGYELTEAIKTTRSLVDGGNFNEAWEIINDCVNVLNSAKMELPGDFAYEETLILLYKIWCGFATNQLTIDKFFNEYDVILNLIEQKFEGKIKDQFASERYPSMLMRILLDIGMSIDDSTTFKMKFIDSATRTKNLFEDYLNYDKRIEECIVFIFNYNLILGEIAGNSGLALMNLVEHWNRIPNHIKMNQMSSFSEIKKINLLLGYTCKLALKEEDFSVLGMILFAQEPYIKQMENFKTELNGSSKEEYNLIRNGFFNHFDIWKERMDGAHHKLASGLKKMNDDFAKQLEEVGIKVSSPKIGFLERLFKKR